MSQQVPSESRISLRFEKFSSFVEGYAANLSLGGMFLETEEQRSKGSIADFEITLKDGFRLMYGLGEVLWVRRVAAGPERPVGLGVRFQALDDSGRELILRILEERVRNGLEPFDVEEIPADVAAAARAGGAALSAEQAPRSEPTPEPIPTPVPEVAPVPASTTVSSPVDTDFEKKILGEDGFTLIDSDRQQPSPEPVQADEPFEEVAFDAPWGEALPDLPEEVLSGDLESEPATITEPPAEVAPVELSVVVPEPVSDIAWSAGASEDVGEPALSDLAVVEAESAMADFEFEDAPQASPREDDLDDVSFAPLRGDDFELDDSSPAPFQDDMPEFEADFEFDSASLTPLREDAPELEVDIEFDDVVGSSRADGNVAQQGGLEASLLLAAQAAEEIDVVPPPSAALDEPDFDDIDFGGPVDNDGGTPAAFDAGVAADFAFEPDPEDQLPPLEQMSEVADVGASPFDAPLDAEDATVIGASVSNSFEEPTLLSSEPLASIGDDAFNLDGEDATSVGGGVSVFDEGLGSEGLGSEEDATVVGMGASAVEVAAEADPWDLGSEPAPASGSGFELSGFEPPDVDGNVLGVGATIPDFPPQAPSLELPTVGPSAAPPTDAALVTVAGAPVSVQDYEDDLFAEEAGAGPGQVVRQALSGKSLIAIALLLALAVAVYFFRGPLAEMTGMSGRSEPVTVSVPQTPGGTTSAGEPGPPEQPAESPASAVSVGEPDIEATRPAIEEVDVAETLPSGDAVASDPAADPGVVPPAIEATRPLASTSSLASRVLRISSRASNDGTLVTVELDGNLDDTRHIHMPLAYNPSREMVKITGIDEPYVESKIAVGSSEIEQIRIGYHAEAGGTELHVVFDYPNVGPQVAAVRNLGDRLEILIASP